MAEINVRTSWPQGTSFQTIMDDLYRDLTQQVNALIDDLEKRLASIPPQQATGIPPENPPPLGQSKQGSLPWFKHGVRGFLRKLWYGDHPTNPDWQQNNSVDYSGRLTIQEYVQIENDVNNTIDGLLSEAGFSGTAKGFFDQFRRDLAKVIQDYTLRLYQLGQQFGYQKAQNQAPVPGDEEPESPPTKEPASPEEPAPPPSTPTSTPTVSPPPEATDATATRRGRPAGSKNKPKEPSISPREELNPLQALLRPRTRNKLHPKRLTAENLAAALKYLHEHGVDITSPVDVVHAMEKLASEKYSDRGDLLALYGKAIGMDPDDEDGILEKLGIKGLKKGSSDHLSPEEIEAELNRLRGEEENSGYDYTGTEGEPGNYQQGDPEEEQFN